nr:helix-turn-helix domain-containing protein [Microbispora sp. GKU 823]
MSSRDGAVGVLLAAEPGRTPRADARRNMERLVEAARAAVAEIGVEVTAHEIARRAGVGIGTFYRRVSSREALLEAVLDEVLAEMADLAADAAATPTPGADSRPSPPRTCGCVRRAAASARPWAAPADRTSTRFSGRSRRAYGSWWSARRRPG